MRCRWSASSLVTIGAPVLAFSLNVPDSPRGIPAPCSEPTPTAKTCKPNPRATEAADSASPVCVSPSLTTAMAPLTVSPPPFSEARTMVDAARLIAAAMSEPGRTSASPGCSASRTCSAASWSRVSGKRRKASPAKMTNPTRSPRRPSISRRISDCAATNRLTGSASPSATSSAAMLCETSRATTSEKFESPSVCSPALHIGLEAATAISASTASRRAREIATP